MDKNHGELLTLGFLPHSFRFEVYVLISPKKI